MPPWFENKPKCLITIMSTMLTLHSMLNETFSVIQEDFGFSFYDPIRREEEEKNIWFLCKYCHLFKILSKKYESMENHCFEYPNHFQLFPDWNFFQFVIFCKISQ